jgi:membrane protein DedA with SNARE-associated domain
MSGQTRRAGGRLVPETSTGVYAYLAVFIALVLAAFGFPIPEEIPVVIAGGLCADAATPPPHHAFDIMAGALGLPFPDLVGPAAAIATIDAPPVPAPKYPQHPIWYIMLPVCILGVVLCDGLLYGIGRFGGPRLLEIAWVKRWIVRPEMRDRIENNFHKYGVRILLGVRLLPGVRAPVFVIAGVLRLPLTRFLFADGIYAILGVSLLFSLAYWFTNQVKEAVTNFTHSIDSFRPYLIIGVIAAVGLFMLYEFWKRRHVTGDPKEVPIIGEKLIKPAETEPFPDSTVISKGTAKKKKDEPKDEHGGKRMTTDRSV